MNNTNQSDHPLISNSFVKCYSDHLVIHLYYFPYGDKKVNYNEMISCELIPLHELGFFKIKLWGTALSSIWWHSDIHRHGRKYSIILDTNKWPKIGLTMDDNDISNVYKFIKEKIQSNQSFTDLKNETSEFTSKKSFEYNKM